MEEIPAEEPWLPRH